MKRRFALVLTGFLLGTLPGLAEGPEGVWLNEAGSMRMRISPCGAAFCGSLVWVRESENDGNNPDPAKRSQPLLGLRILSGMVPSGSLNEWKGTAYDPANGRTFAEIMSLEDDRLLTHGCVTGSAICHSATWSRVN